MTIKTAYLTGHLAYLNQHKKCIDTSAIQISLLYCRYQLQFMYFMSSPLNNSVLTHTKLKLNGIDLIICKCIVITELNAVLQNNFFFEYKKN